MPGAREGCLYSEGLAQLQADLETSGGNAQELKQVSYNRVSEPSWLETKVWMMPNAGLSTNTANGVSSVPEGRL